MKKLSLFIDEYGEFFPSSWEELVPVVQEMDEAIANELAGLDLSRIKHPVIRAARLDLAMYWLSSEYEFKRVIHSFNDMTRAELYFVHSETRSVIANKRLGNVLHTLGWLPKLTQQTINRITAQPDMSLRTVKKIVERFA
jgi:hypothetical protein